MVSLALRWGAGGSGRVPGDTRIFPDVNVHIAAETFYLNCGILGDRAVIWANLYFRLFTFPKKAI